MKLEGGLFQAIKETAYLEANAHYPLPSILHTFTDFFTKAHLYWWAFKDARLFIKSHQREIDQGNPAVYGAAIHFLSDYSYSLNYLVKIALIIKCIEDLLVQYRHVHTAYCRLHQAIYVQYPCYHADHLNCSSSHMGIPISYRARLQAFSIYLKQQILKVIHCWLQLMLEIFKLSMCLRDIYLISQNDPLARYRACTEMIANIEMYQKQLRKDYSTLYQQIKRRKKWINQIFIKLGWQSRLFDIGAQIEKLIAPAETQRVPMLPKIWKAGQEWMTPCHTIGKVVSIQLDFTKKKDPIFLDATPFPPWRGQSLSKI